MTAPLKAGRYQLLEELGRGAMGVVYRAQDPVIGRMVAVKTVHLTEQSSGMSHEDLLARFQTEARAAGLLTHPNIVVVHDAGEDDGLFYIIMELVEGRSLQSLLEARTAFPLARIMRIMQQACSALDFAHQHKVVHRDIKPANLMLTADDTLKITDFGTAKILQYGTSHTALAIGTPSYMSPEQIKGRPVDGRSDVFSLGVVLYEMLTGEKPFAGESVTTVIYKIVNEDPVPPRDLDSSIPPGLSEIVARALAKSPEARLQNCREFWRMLQNYRDFAGTSAPALAAPRSTPVAAPNTSKFVPRQESAQTPPTLTPEAAARYLSSTQPFNQPLENSRRSSSPWIALLLLVVIGAAGYRVSPAMREVWQRSRPMQSALLSVFSNAKSPAESSQVRPDVSTAAAPAPEPASQASPDPKPDAASSFRTPLAGGDASSEPARPDPAPAATKSSAAAQNVGQSRRTGLPDLEAPAPKQVSQSASAVSDLQEPATLTTTRPPAAPPAAKSPAAAAAETGAPAPTPKPAPQGLSAATRGKRRIEAELAESAADEKVHITVTGNTLTLTGNLPANAHEKLLNWLRSNPMNVQIIDDIEFEEAPPQ